VEKTPDAIAVVFEDQQLTYRELNAKANQLAHYLRRSGVGPEGLVGICVERSLEMIVGILGILKAGGAYVPLDPAYPRERLWFMIEETRALVLLTQKRLLSVLPEHGVIVCLDADWELICRNSSENLSSEVSTDHLAYVMYTSGSTGRPKGVSVIHKGVIRLVRETNYAELTSREVFMQFSPFSFDASTIEIWGCFLNGGKLVIYPAHTPSLDELGNFIREQSITTLWLTSALFHQMVDEQLDSLRGVRQMLTGGDVLSSRHARDFLERQSDCRLINGYGPTENTTFTCCYQMTAPDHVGNSVLIGRPVSNTMVYILDQNLQPVPVGVIGELHAGGAGLAREYLNRPELTAEKFIPNPFSEEPGERLYRTGDLARYHPDGNIEFLGRIDHQVKIRGFRIEPGEIEVVLAQHPSVVETVVIARENSLGDKQLVAYVVLNEKSAVTNNELRNFLRQKLPDYMMPSAFVSLDSLPLTPNGKVNRRALPAPDSERPGAEDSYVAPRNSVEEILAGIWREVLGLKKVGIHNNFFELGGHSLLATQVISRLRKVFEIEIPLRTLFESPTVGELAFALLQRECERKTVEQRAALLLKVAELSEDEINTMLEEQIRERDNNINE
jgi:aspartate racemase